MSEKKTHDTWGETHRLCTKCRIVHAPQLPCPPSQVMILDPATDTVEAVEDETEAAATGYGLATEPDENICVEIFHREAIDQ